MGGRDGQPATRQSCVLGLWPSPCRVVVMSVRRPGPGQQRLRRQQQEQEQRQERARGRATEPGRPSHPPGGLQGPAEPGPGRRSL